jgi:hypothetical protein
MIRTIPSAPASIPIGVEGSFYVRPFSPIYVVEQAICIFPISAADLFAIINLKKHWTVLLLLVVAWMERKLIVVRLLLCLVRLFAARACRTCCILRSELGAFSLTLSGARSAFYVSD